MYSATKATVLVGRVASIPVETAVRLYESTDPFEAAREFFSQNAYARLALELASPSLFPTVMAWVGGSDPGEKVKSSAFSYALRMATRCTPFGFFSGVAEVAFGEQTTADFDAARARTRTRPDMSVVADVIERAEATHRGAISYVTNDCAFVRGDRVHVIDVRMGTGSERGAIEQRDVSLRHTRAVALVRDACASPRRFDEIVEALAAEFGASADESRRLLGRLIDAGVLLCDLRPSTTGDPIAYVVERLQLAAVPEAQTLQAARARAQRVDSAAEFSASAYREVAAAFNDLAPSMDYPVQIDLHAGLRGTLASCVADDVATVANLYARAGRVFRMSAYRERFLARYEGSERLVPLLELVDGSVGLGAPEGASLESPPSPGRDARLLHLFTAALRAGDEEVQLSGELLDAVLPAHGDGREMGGFEIGFALAARERGDIDAGDYTFVTTYVSDRVGKSTARFADLLGPAFRERLQDAVHAAYHPDDAVAEFSFSPMISRTYNVCVRPLLHRHEVRAGIGAPALGDAISPADLFVGIDADNAFYLWSQKLQRRVLVAETHALGTAISAPNLCRFLAQIQLDGARVPEIDLGAAEALPYLPRLCVGRIVLRPRRWLLPRAELLASEGSARARELWMLPRYVSLRENDHRLLLDLEAPIVRSVLEAQSKGDTLHLEEALPSPNETWLPSADGRHAVEFVASVVAAQTPPSRTRGSAPIVANPRRRFGPGSQWIYAKYYLGPRSADDLLLRSIAPVVRDFEERGCIDRWFFLRYADSRPHLRVRLHAPALDQADALRSQLAEHAQQLLETQTIDAFSFDTYDPEYERYGGEEQIERAERFFHLDSRRCLEWLGEGHTTTDARVEAAAAAFDDWLRESPETSERLIRICATAAAGKLVPFDRESLRRLRVRGSKASESPFEDALRGERSDARLGAYIHLHCNRFGLDGEGERRVVQLLRALALGRKSAHRPSPVPASM